MSKNYIDLSDENFNEELALTDKLILVDFWNEACIPCKRMAPMLERLAMEYEDKLKLAKVNADRNPKTIKKYNIKQRHPKIFITSLSGISVGFPKHVLPSLLRGIKLFKTVRNRIGGAN